jgi:hypothetical protein
MTDRIGFSTGTGLLSRIIRFFTDSGVSHAWVLYYDVDFGRDMVLEATLEGVRIVPYDVFQKHNKIVKVVSPKHDLKLGFTKMGEALGEHYDFTGLLGMAWVMVGRWLRRKWHNPLVAASAMWCSEMVAWVLKWSSYPGTEFLDPHATSPQDLYEFFLKEGSRP